MKEILQYVVVPIITALITALITYLSTKANNKTQVELAIKNQEIKLQELNNKILLKEKEIEQLKLNHELELKSKTLDFCYESEYQESEDKVYIAIVTIEEVKSDQYLTDMRLKGGGLPEDMPDNFNLLDIGHIYGRPYRQANTLAITLPKKYEPYKKEILDIVEKYKVAEDYTILFFEDEDGENS